MADKNYISQIQGDADSTDALTHCTVVNVTIAGDGRAGPYYPGNARSIITTATSTCKFQMRGGGGAGLAATTYRDMVMSAEHETATATQTGTLTAEAMPHEFYLFDTSGAENKVTMYINY